MRDPLRQTPSCAQLNCSGAQIHQALELVDSQIAVFMMLEGARSSHVSWP